MSGGGRIALLLRIRKYSPPVLETAENIFFGCSTICQILVLFPFARKSPANSWELVIVEQPKQRTLAHFFSFLQNCVRPENIFLCLSSPSKDLRPHPPFEILISYFFFFDPFVFSFYARRFL